MDYYGVEDISKELKISERYVRDLFSKGTLIGHKIGNRWVTTKKMLDEYIESGDNNEKVIKFTIDELIRVRVATKAYLDQYRNVMSESDVLYLSNAIAKIDK